MLLPNLFIACYILFALFWDSPEHSLLHKSFRARIGGLVRWAGLTHTWNMYAGPFRTVTRLETRVRYAGGNVQVLPAARRYELRRYYFMMGASNSLPYYNRYLNWIGGRLPERCDAIECIELVRRVWKSPSRRGDIGQRFEIPRQQTCRETVVARWIPE